jgi:zinc and cadmium transporter
MTPLLGSLLAVGAISLVSLIGITTLSLKEGLLRRVLFLLISLAAGALLGDAFIHLLPEAFSEADPLLVSLTVIGGILSFFLLEKFLHWHHSHGDEEFSPEHAKIHPVGGLVLVSDGVHNLIDGLAIGAAFMVSTEIGIATAIAIALHEIPQEIGDFGLLLHAGFSRAKALLYNFVSALTAFIGVFVAFWLQDAHEAMVPLIAAFAAGNFIYIALADLVPELHKTPGGKRSIAQFVVIVLGIAAMVGLLALEGDEHHREPSHETHAEAE